MDYLNDLLDRAEAFARSSGQSVSTISGKLFGNGSRIEEYRAGTRSPTFKVLEAAERRLAELQNRSKDKEVA